MIKQNSPALLFSGFLFAVAILITACDTNYFQNDKSILDKERFPAPVSLSAADIEWFRTFKVSWIFAETGSPAIILPSLTLESQYALFESNKDELATLLDFERVFTAFAVYARLEPGHYLISEDHIAGELPSELLPKAEFELTQTHITLLRNAWWRQGYIDPKYPYGNYGYYEADMALTLGQHVPTNSQTGVFELSNLEQKKYQRLHHELLYALQVFIQYAEIEPGVYQLPVDGWKHSFVRLRPPTDQQIASYMKNAVILKNKFSRGEGDSIIDWMYLTETFSEVLD